MFGEDAGLLGDPRNSLAEVRRNESSGNFALRGCIAGDRELRDDSGEDYSELVRYGKGIHSYALYLFPESARRILL
jgi:hypothetical protein